MIWEMRCFLLGLKLRGGYYLPLRAPGGGYYPFTPSPLCTPLYVEAFSSFSYDHEALNIDDFTTSTMFLISKGRQNDC